MSKRPQLLIVEDDRDLRLMFRMALTLDGFDVHEAADGLDALRHLEGSMPDLVVLDLGLPKVAGTAVLLELAAHPQTRDIPVLVVTATASHVDGLNPECFMRKPVRPENLVAAVRRCLRGRRHSQAQGWRAQQAEW